MFSANQGIREAYKAGKITSETSARDLKTVGRDAARKALWKFVEDAYLPNHAYAIPSEMSRFAKWKVENVVLDSPAFINKVRSSAEWQAKVQGTSTVIQRWIIIRAMDGRFIADRWPIIPDSGMNNKPYLVNMTHLMLSGGNPVMMASTFTLDVTLPATAKETATIKLTSHDNFSGHFTPPAKSLLRNEADLLDQLAQHGIDVTETKRIAHSFDPFNDVTRRRMKRMLELSQRRRKNR